jgi:1-deoxy-D-xylulose-5-phosphate reductoisomerase
MGKKITVDSATLMNKGFEIIEAAHLFSVGADKIEVVIHRESILHSAVEYIDNTVIGEFSVPDMRMCVGYAVDYPDRNEAVADELDLIKLGKLTFMKPDTEAFPLLALAGRAMSLGGAMPAVVNAADEIAVGAFLDEKISFADIPKVVISTFEKMTAHANDRTLEEILTADREAREIARGEIA